MGLQPDCEMLTLFRQFWQCICTSTLGDSIIMQEEGNNLWHCLPNWSPKLSFQIDVSMVLQADCRDLTLFRQFWQCICTDTLDVLVIVLKESNNLWYCLPNWLPKLSFKLIWAWPFKQIAGISHCLDNFDNAFAPASRVYSISSWRRATICGIAFPIDAWNSATDLNQHCLVTRLQRSYTVQTVVTINLHQCLVCTCHCPGEGQQSVALPP